MRLPQLPGGGRPFFCNWLFCCKRFTRSDELQRHLRTHISKKRFVGHPVCNKRFMCSEHISKHVETHSAGGSGKVGSSSCVSCSELEERASFRPPRLILHQFLFVFFFFQGRTKRKKVIVPARNNPKASAGVSLYKELRKKKKEKRKFLRKQRDVINVLLLLHNNNKRRRVQLFSLIRSRAPLDT